MNGRGKLLRDLVLFGMGAALFHHEFWIEEDPREIAVLVAGLLIGFVPALHADDSLSSGPLALFLRALGLKVERVDPESQETSARAAREDREDREDREARDRAAARAAREAREEREAPDLSDEGKRSRPSSDGPESP